MMLTTTTLGRNLEFSQTGNSISVSSLSSELRVLTIIMFHNLYPLSNTRYMNLGRVLMKRSTFVLISFIFYAKLFYELI